MQVSLSPAIAFCKHCGSLVPRERSDGFCCGGCLAVFEILTASGLGEYYKIMETSVCFQKPKPVSSIHSNFDFQSNDCRVRFYLEGIHCSACLWLLERLPLMMPDAVVSCSLSLSTSIFSIELKKPEKVNEVATQIFHWGYTPHLISVDGDGKDQIEKENRARLLDLGIAGALAGNVMLMSIPLYSGVTGNLERLFEVLSFLLAIPSLFYSGRTFFKNVYSAFKSKVFPIDAPILLALLVAFFYSTYSLVIKTHQLYFDSLTALIFLLLASRYYLSRLRQSSQMHLGALSFFQADYSGKVGDLEVLKNNEKIRFDGVVRSGSGWCDSSQFTGETEPIRVQVGDMVYAGTRFLSSDSEVSVEVQKIASETRIAKLLQKISDVQSKRTKTELASDRWSQRLLITVMVVGMISLAFFFLDGRLDVGIKRVLALLIVTCPCALALATPLVFTLAMKLLLKEGVLIKDPASLDQVPEMKNIFFDKTGTLTEGRLQADVDLKCLLNEDLSVLYSMVRQSRHPISRAIEKAFADQKIVCKVLQFTEYEEKMGYGLFAETHDDHYSLSRPLKSCSVFTEAAFCKDQVEICRIILKDHSRAESKSVIGKIQKMGLNVHILSGDSEKPVHALACELGVSQYHSKKNPEEKSQLSNGSMMVGDGVNDALALSTAKVSVAVQGGMEAAIQSAQVFSIKPGISTLIPLFEVAGRVRRTLKQNFILSTSYNLVGAFLSLSGFMNPLIAALLMPASALTVFWSSVYRMRGK